MDAAFASDSYFSLQTYDGSLDIDDRDLTTSALDLLSDSRELYMEKRHGALTPEHVALLLFSPPAGWGCQPAGYTLIGSRILSRAGVDPQECADFLHEELKLSSRPKTDNRGINYSRAFVCLLRDAQQETFMYQDPLIGVDHIALALALYLQRYGSDIGIEYTRFQKATECIRGLSRPEATLEFKLDDGSSSGSLDELELTEAEKAMIFESQQPVKMSTTAQDELEPTKLDRVSPASSAPDSPPPLTDSDIDSLIMGLEVVDVGEPESSCDCAAVDVCGSVVSPVKPSLITCQSG